MTTALKTARLHLAAFILALLSIHVIADDAPSKLTIHRDVQWAQVGSKKLTADIFTPRTRNTSLPVVVIYHGGGWLINDNRIMESTARYLAEHGNFVVANMNYRLLGDNDNTTTMDDIIEDSLGGLVWVKENIAQYGDDPERIAVTGDSAGGHLSAMVVLAAQNLSSEGFSEDNLAFRPTYTPENTTPEQLAERNTLQVQAAVLSYGAFDIYAAAKNGFESPENFFWEMGGAQPRGIFGAQINAEKDPALYKAVSPLYLIPSVEEYRLPPIFVHVGSQDTTTPPEAVSAFVEKLKSAGQTVEYTVYPDKNHAFLDSGCNEYLGNCFDKDAPEALDDMISFLNKHLH